MVLTKTDLMLPINKCDNINSKTGTKVRAITAELSTIHFHKEIFIINTMLRVFVTSLAIILSQLSAVSVTTTKLVVNTVQCRKRNE